MLNLTDQANMYPPTYHKSIRRNSLPSPRKPEEKVGKSTCCSSWQWYEPPQNSAPVRFFLDTSLHGLQYLGQSNRHICERIFWLSAFILAVIASTLLIWEMYDGYITMPIITVFNPTEKTLEQIPFPAVTICNVNNVKRSIWEKHNRAASPAALEGLSNETILKRLATVNDIMQICQSAGTLTDKFKLLKTREELRKSRFERRIQNEHLQDPIGTLRNSSQSCEEMILLCLWLGGEANCSELFEEVATDFGICCTFNMIPVSLLRRGINNTRDDPNLIKEWEELNINHDNLVLKDHDEDRKYPYRQRYHGRSAGLSFLVDPELEEYHCTNTDSEGFVVALHLPLDFPRIRDNGNAVRTKSEVFIGVRPEITMPAESVKQFKVDERHCYFDGEKSLKFYKKYTSSNCVDECISAKTLDECKCVRYYMPRGSNANNIRAPLCKPDKYLCTEEVKEKIMQNGLELQCSDCLPSCSEILYHSEATSLKIRQQHIDELLELYPNLPKAKDASIVHVYFNVDSVYPRLLKEKSTVIELISNAGGLLGLCMGFSMLSLLEILYHATVRVLISAYRKRHGKADQEKEKDSQIADGFQDMDPNNFSFLSKMLNHHESNLVQNLRGSHHQNEGDKLFYKTENTSSAPQTDFCTPFEADFQRAYHATSWLPQKMS